jgi:adenosylhomocysteine nucleosidase
MLLKAVQPDGRVNLAHLLPLLLRRTVTLGVLLRLATGSRLACSTLSKVTRFASRELGLSPIHSFANAWQARED